MVSLAFFKVPIVLQGSKVLVYDFDYTYPKSHLRVGQDLLEALRAISRTCSYFGSEEIKAALKRTGVVGFLNAPATPTAGLGKALIESSLGGPNLWAEKARKRLGAELYMSFQSRKIYIGDLNIEAPEPWNRFIFCQLCRALLLYYKCQKLLIVGREIGAKVADLFKLSKTVVLETGFAEDQLPQTRLAPPLLPLARDEIIFRNYTYPWDNLAHAAMAVESILQATQNVFWNARIMERLRAHFPEARFIYVPPSIPDLNHFLEFPMQTPSKTVRILAGTGKHTTGKQGVTFLNLNALMEATAGMSQVRVSVLCEDPEMLSATTALPQNWEIIPRVEPDAVPRLLSQVHLYYRVQNDSSVPLGNLEAMASGKIVFFSEETKDAFPELSHRDNCILVSPGNSSMLKSEIEMLLSHPTSAESISSAARSLVSNHCQLSNLCSLIGW